MTSIRPRGIFLLCLSGALTVHAEETVLLPEVRVTAKTVDVTEQRVSSTQKVVLERREIENLGVMTIGEVLVKLPGVEGAANADGTSTQRVRGMSRDSADILVDGERPAGGSRIVSGVIGRLPSGDLERVEILRGSSAEFGGSASVTVNLILKKALAKRATSVKAAAGLRGNEPNGQFNWTKNGGEGDVGWTFPVTLNLTRSPSNTTLDRQAVTTGTRTLWQQDNQNALYTFREFVISPRISWKSGRDSLSVSPLFFDGMGKRSSQTGLLTYTNPSLGTGVTGNGDQSAMETNHRRMMRLRIEGEKGVDSAKLSGRIALNYGNKTIDIQRAAINPAGISSNAYDTTLNRENEVNTALRWDQSIGLNFLSVGGEFVKLMRNDNQTFGGNLVSQAVHVAASHDGILWVQNEWTPKTAFTLTTGLRSENMGISSDGVAQQHTAWLPSVSTRWEFIDKWVMRSSLGAGMKMPKIDEISNATVLSVAANTPVEPDKRGNPNLRPERSVNFEAVLERYLPGESGVLGANLYLRSTQDFTEHQVQLEGARWVDRPYNAGSAQHWGMELDGKVRADGWGWKGATVKAHLTLPNARVNDSQLGITRMARDTPRYVISTGLDQNLPSYKSSFGVSLQHSGASVTLIPGVQYGVTHARTMLDAFWLYKLNPKFNLRVSGQNLLAENTVRQNSITSASNTWQLGTTDNGMRSLMFTLEGGL